MEALENSLRQNPGLQDRLRVNPPENARLSFEQIAKDQLHDMVERNFRLYQRINRDSDFQRVLVDLLFGRMLKGMEGEKKTPPRCPPRRELDAGVPAESGPPSIDLLPYQPSVPQEVQLDRWSASKAKPCFSASSMQINSTFDPREMTFYANRV